MADACRARYIIDGKEFSFNPEGVREVSEEQAVLRRSDFVARILNALVNCLGDSASNGLLLHVAMLLLSQSSLALLMEGQKPIALCGGHRTLVFEIAREGLQWKVKGTSGAHGFRQFQVQSHDVADAAQPKTCEGEVLLSGNCSSASSVQRGFSCRLSARASPGNAEGTVTVAVDEAFEDLAIFSPEGLPLTFSPQTQQTGQLPSNAATFLQAAGDAVSAWLWPAQGTSEWHRGKSRPVSGMGLFAHCTSDTWISDQEEIQERHANRSYEEGSSDVFILTL